MQGKQSEHRDAYPLRELSLTHSSGGFTAYVCEQTAPESLPAWLAWLLARFPRPRSVHREGATGEGSAVEDIHGALRCVAIWSRDDAKAP